MTDPVTLKKDLVFSILQFLAEEGFTESANKYFEDRVLTGDWVEVEKYLSRFTRLDENQYSMKIYFEIRKQKYLEALDRKDKNKSVDILVKELKVFQQVNEGLYKQITQLITLSNFREHELLSTYGDTRATRTKLMLELKKLVEANPIFIDKLTFPDISSGRIKTLINQSLNWQHEQCSHPSPNPVMRSLAIDHVCPPPTGVIPLPSPPLAPAPAPATVAALPIRPMPNYVPIRVGFDFNPVPKLLVGESYSNSHSGVNAPMSRAIVNVPDHRLIIMPHQITEPGKCLIVTMADPDSDLDIKVGKLMYMNSGCGLLALTTSGNHKVWKWPENGTMANVIPRIWQPNSTIVPLRNDMSTRMNYEASVPSLAITKNDSYLLSSCGGKVVFFSIAMFKGSMLLTPPPASTFVSFHPEDKDIMVFGKEDGTIQIYNVNMDVVQLELRSHQKSITGLTFSCMLRLMVSSGADAQICVWSLNTWENKNSLLLQLPGGKEAPPSGATSVQFHTDQIHILVSNGTQLTIYNGSTMTLLLQWVPQGNLRAPISGATYSCDCQMVYAAFRDASIGIFDSNNLSIMCRIAPNVYMPTPLLDGYENESVALAAHPFEPNQFAVGLSNGSVKVMQPKPAGGKWGEYLSHDPNQLSVAPMNILYPNH